MQEQQINRPRATSRTIFDATMVDQHSRSGSLESSSSSGGRAPLQTVYDATGETPALDPKAAGSSSPTKAPSKPPTIKTDLPLPKEDDYEYPPAQTPTTSTDNDIQARPRSTSRGHGRRSSTMMSRRSSVYERKLCWSLPSWLRRPLWAWLDRVMMVLSPEWLRTTILVWAVWCSMSLGEQSSRFLSSLSCLIAIISSAYTMFNVYLPKLLETGSAATVLGAEVPHAPGAKTLEQSLWDVVIFTVGGCPGAIVRLTSTRLKSRALLTTSCL